jgi:hypothetical protein
MGHAPLVVSTEGCEYTVQVTIFRNSKPLDILMAKGFILPELRLSSTSITGVTINY